MLWLEQNAQGEVVITLKDVYEMVLDSNKKLDKLAISSEGYKSCKTRLDDLEISLATCQAQCSAKEKTEDKGHNKLAVNIQNILLFLTWIAMIAIAIWK